MIKIAWIFWIVVLATITFIFWRLWIFAGKIENAEEEEQQWIQYIANLRYTNPQWAEYYQRQFEERFLK